jgi:hypothetical protein
MTSAAAPGTSPNVRMSIVLSTRPWAGLTPGKSFSTPKARKIAPMLKRRIAML